MHALSLLAAASGDGGCLKSGAMPSLSMSVNAGVRYLPFVMTMPEPSDNSYTLCISPLPNVLHTITPVCIPNKNVLRQNALGSIDKPSAVTGLL